MREADPLDEWLRQLPKVELHLHLEGAIPLEALAELTAKYGERVTTEALSERFRYRDFPHFLEAWMWKNGFIREYEDFTFIASAVAEDLARQNIRYVEAFHSPGDFAMLHGLEVPRITAAVSEGLARHRDRIEVRLIADLTRDFGPERGAGWLEELAASQELPIIGIGIGGSEHAFPPEPYESLYERARVLGLRTTAHAGEAAGAESIWGAVRTLRVDRVGHGTRAFEDSELLDHLREHRIPLEMCPTSNVRTGVVPGITHHPIRDFYDQGLLVSVNTDDPKMFQTSLDEEYRTLVEEHLFRREDILALIGNAIASSWADETTKRKLAQELSASGSG